MNKQLCLKCPYRFFGHSNVPYCDMRAWELIATQTQNESDCFAVSVIDEPAFKTPKDCPYKLEHLMSESS